MPLRPARQSRFVAAVFAVVLSPVLRADAQGEEVAVHYRASEGCPDLAQFIEQIRARTPRAAVAPEQSGMRVFFASISTDGDAYRGKLETRELDGTVHVREVVGDRCEDAAAALSLIIALAVDPKAQVTPEAPSPPVTASSVPPVAPPAIAPLPAPIAHKPGDTRSPDSARAVPWAWRMSVDIALLQGMAPDPSFGASMFVEASQPAYSARVGVAWANSELISGADRVAAYQRTAVLADGCPLVFAPTTGMTLRPCVTAELGRIRAKGTQVANPEQQTRLWLTAGLLGRATLGLGAGWFLEADGAALFPSTRPVFVFENPKLVVHEVPWYAWRAQLGLGATIF